MENIGVRTESNRPETVGTVLQVSALSHRYPSGRRALNAISFEMALGEVVGLVGPNGAGKTTLLMHLNGLLGVDGLPESRVCVHVLGLPVCTRNLSEVRRTAGLLFQDPDDQLFCATVGEDVAFGPRNLGLPEPEVQRRVHSSLAAVDLTEFANRDVHELSYGERRRVCLAGVLACDPSLLLLDEPSGNLDPRARRKIIAALKQCPVAQLIASHDLELILELCSRVIVLDAGSIRADGPTHTILSNATLMQEHGLEVPYSLR